MKYIFDTSSIIVLLEVCGLESQLKSFSSKNQLYMPHRVREEYLRGAKVCTATSLSLFSIITVDLSDELLPYFHFDSSSGEIWVISHVITHQDYCCVIDEEFGRNICKLFQLKLIGAIGIIQRLKEKGFLSNEDLEKIRKKIRNSHFYLSQKLLKKLDQICL